MTRVNNYVEGKSPAAFDASSNADTTGRRPRCTATYLNDGAAQLSRETRVPPDALDAVDLNQLTHRCLRGRGHPADISP